MRKRDFGSVWPPVSTLEKHKALDQLEYPKIHPDYTALFQGLIHASTTLPQNAPLLHGIHSPIHVLRSMVRSSGAQQFRAQAQRRRAPLRRG